MAKAAMPAYREFCPSICATLQTFSMDQDLGGCMRKLAISLAALAFAIPTSASAEIMPWVQQAWHKLQSEFGYGDEDRLILLGSFAAQLAPTQYWEVQATPQASGRIYVSAACDDDCSGLVVEVRDATGRYVGTRWHRQNSVYFEAEEEQTYDVRFRLNNCGAPFCFALGLTYQLVE